MEMVINILGGMAHIGHAIAHQWAVWLFWNGLCLLIMAGMLFATVATIVCTNFLPINPQPLPPPIPETEKQEIKRKLWAMADDWT